MIAFAAAVVLGGAFGLATGNAQDRVLVAAYELGVIPAYFFLATLTLSSPMRLRPGHGQAIAFRALLAGFMVAAAFAGPTDGHWELGLLAALSLVAARFEHLGVLR